MFTFILCRGIKKRGSSLLNVIRYKIKCHVKGVEKREGGKLHSVNCMQISRNFRLSCFD